MCKQFVPNLESSVRYLGNNKQNSKAATWVLENQQKSTVLALHQREQFQAIERILQQRNKSCQCSVVQME